jgi:hypothetical protein
MSYPQSELFLMTTFTVAPARQTKGISFQINHFEMGL